MGTYIEIWQSERDYEGSVRLIVIPFETTH